MTLSKSQQEAEKVFMDFLDNPNQRELVIAGFAGSGKTFLVKHLNKRLDQFIKMQKTIDLQYEPPKVFFTATTNKAATVLKSFILAKHVTTIHSLLGLKVDNDLKSGKTTCETTTKTRPIKGIVFIDEASMIGRDLYKVIREYTKEAKVIYIGDNYQLPPVFENGSIVFKSKNTIYLNEIQRQVENHPIIELSQKYREIIDKNPPFAWPEIEPDNKNIFTLEGHEFEDMVRTKFSEEHQADDYKILAYTNKKVIAYNRFVRNLYTSNVDFEPGEYVMTNKPIMEGNRVVVMTDAVLKIGKVHHSVSTEQIEGFEILFVNRLDEPFAVGFYPKNSEEVDALLKHYAKYKDWKSYYHIKEKYLDIRSLHALTCHKAQGSTYKEVFIDLNDIGTNKKYNEIARMVYVAITRAKHKVYLYGKLPNRWRS